MNNRFRRLAASLLSLLLLLSTASSVSAAGDPGSKAHSPQAAQLEDPVSYSVLDSAELETMVREFMEERGMNEKNFSFSYCFLGTGETWDYNGDKYFPGGSLYKLPMMMGVADKIADGELDANGKIYAWDIPYIMERSLTHSDNPISERVIGFFGAYNEFRAMQAELSGLPAEQIPAYFFNHGNDFSSNFMRGVLLTMVSCPVKYATVISSLKNANPGEYFRLSLDGQYEVAQKYGSIKGGYIHTAGVVYTPTPFLLTVMTKHVSHAEQCISELAQMMADYTLTLDQRLSEAIAEDTLQQEKFL